ncbi:hypothetical protein REPUB_Repub01dG0245800 [Reevesia pubescens]
MALTTSSPACTTLLKALQYYSNDEPPIGSSYSLSIFSSSKPLIFSSKPKINNSNPFSVENAAVSSSLKYWRTRVSFFSGFLTKGKGKGKGKVVNRLKDELFDAISPLDRGAEATLEDQQLVNQRPKFLRPNGKIYQAINLDTLRAQNMETWPFFNQVTANLVPLNPRRVAVKFDYFKIAGLIPIKSPGSGRGQLEITYLDDELRISRGDRGNLFILKMVDPSYRVPL